MIFPPCFFLRFVLYYWSMPEWRNGRRGGFKIRWQRCRAGSSPAFGTFTKSLETQAFQGFFYVLECTFTLSFTLCQPENTLSGPPPWDNGMWTPHFGAIITVIPQTLILQGFFVAHAGAEMCSIAQKSPRFAAGGSFYAFAWSMNACIRVALSLRICSVTWP